MRTNRQITPKLVDAPEQPLPHQWTREEQVELDGVSYDICVAKHNGRLLAVCVCNECCEQASINLGSSTAKEAIERAIVGLRLHHDSNHRHRRKPR
jgi:hypothetical protein